MISPVAESVGGDVRYIVEKQDTPIEFQIQPLQVEEKK